MKLLAKFILSAVMAIGVLGGTSVASAGDSLPTATEHGGCPPGFVETHTGACVALLCEDGFYFNSVLGYCVPIPEDLCHNWKMVCPDPESDSSDRNSQSSESERSSPPQRLR